MADPPITPTARVTSGIPTVFSFPTAATALTTMWPQIPDIAIYEWIHRSYGDIPYVMYVPNGNYKVTMKTAQTYSVNPGDVIFHWEEQGQLVYPNVDIVKLAG